MVNSAVSGVAFSRHPLRAISSDCVFIEAVFGLGEGLVGGELDSDRYEVGECTVQHISIVYSVVSKQHHCLSCLVNVIY